MTPAQQSYLARLRGLRTPQRSNIGLPGGSPDPATLDQGPLPDGGNLGQQPLPPAAGRVPGANRFTVGNVNRGVIDLGAFVSARPNQEALNQLAANPLANVDPYQATSGFGGFFRRLLGDNANELNAAAAADRGELARRKWLLDQEGAMRRGLLDASLQNDLSVEDKRNQFQRERDAAMHEYGMQGRRYDAATELSRDINRNVDDLLRDTRQQSFTAEQNRLNRASNEEIAGGRNEAMQLRYLLNQVGRGGSDGFKVPPSLGYDPLTDSYTRWNDLDGKFESIPRMGGQPQAGGATGVVPNEAMNELTRQKVAEVNQRQIVEQAGAPGSAVSGFGRAIGDAASAVVSPLGNIADWLRNNSVVGAAVSEAGGALSAYDEARRAEDLNRLLQQRLLNARNR